MEGPSGGGNVLLNVVNESLDKDTKSRTFTVKLPEAGKYYLALQNCKTPVPCMKANARAIAAHIQIHKGNESDKFVL